jgi:two-component sensor histidine kinase
MQLSVRPDWNEFDLLRERATDYLRQCDVPSESAGALAMVVGELAENAAKYGTFRRSCDVINVSLTRSGDAVTIEVCNPLGPKELEHVARLDRMIQWIRGFQDPFEAWLERLKDVSSQALASEESGLGLTRIAYEGQAVLDFVVRDRNLLFVSAVHRLDVGRF